MKGPIEYQTPWVQERIIAQGTREEIVAWFCWNDLNGNYTDEDSDAECHAALTRVLAPQIMRDQLSQ